MTRHRRYRCSSSETVVAAWARAFFFSIHFGASSRRGDNALTEAGATPFALASNTPSSFAAAPLATTYVFFSFPDVCAGHISV